MIQRTKSYNRVIAQFGLDLKKKRFPLGALNRKDLFDASPEEFTQQLIILIELRTKYSLGEVSLDSDLVNQLKGAFCDELAQLTRELIKKKVQNLDTCVEIARLDSHSFIVIGRKKESNPNDPATWGDEHAVILDPWSDEIYTLAEFKIKQKSNIAIPMYKFASPTLMKILPIHYLSGTPSIRPFANEANPINNQQIRDKVSVNALINKKDPSIKNLPASYDEGLKFI